MSMRRSRNRFAVRMEPMNHRDITPEQFQTVNQTLFRGTNYLLRLKKRMEKLGFQETDPFYVKVKKAYDAAIDLGVFVHYASCESGVG